MIKVEQINFTACLNIINNQLAVCHYVAMMQLKCDHVSDQYQSHPHHKYAGRKYA